MAKKGIMRTVVRVVLNELKKEGDPNANVVRHLKEVEGKVDELKSFVKTVPKEMMAAQMAQIELKLQQHHAQLVEALQRKKHKSFGERSFREHLDYVNDSNPMKLVILGLSAYGLMNAANDARTYYRENLVAQRIIGSCKEMKEGSRAKVEMVKAVYKGIMRKDPEE